MKLEEILQDVDTYVANSVTVKQKVRWLNNIQRELYRDFKMPDAFYSFMTEPGVSRYSLPATCSPDRINLVVVDNNEIDFLELSEDATEQFYTIVTGDMILYPEPVGEVQVTVYFKPRPVDLSHQNIDVTPEFHEDYHEILVFGLAARVAKAQKDVALANNFTGDFMELVEKAKQHLKPKRSKKVRVTRAWR